MSRPLIPEQVKDWDDLAGVKASCSSCRGRGEHIEGHGPTDYERYMCDDCGGTSLVYLFPETVREWCEHCYMGVPVPCHNCQSRGWNASRDGWVWMEAVVAWYSFFLSRWVGSWDDYGNNTYKLHLPDDLEADFLTMLAAAVNSMPGRVWPE